MVSVWLALVMWDESLSERIYLPFTMAATIVGVNATHGR